jgi:hypothetical protein
VIGRRVDSAFGRFKMQEFVTFFDQKLLYFLETFITGLDIIPGLDVIDAFKAFLTSYLLLLHDPSFAFKNLSSKSKNL